MKVLLTGKESTLCPVDGWRGNGGGNGGECASKGVSLLSVLFSANITEYPIIDTLD